MKRIKKICLFIVAECFKALFRLLMFALVVYAAGKIISLETKKKPVESGTYIEISLAEKIAESRVITPFDFKKEINFYGLLKNLEEAEKDKRVEGLILKLDDVGLSRGQAEEFVEKIKEFKKNGKKIYAYAPSFTNKSYVIASASDKIIMPKTMGAMSDIKGYYLEVPYYKALGDKLGLKMNVISIGEYKSAGEPFERDSMSKEYRENMTKMLDSLYNNFVKEVAENRKINPELLSERILEGRFVLADPETMLRNGLIDETEYYGNFLYKNGIVNKIGMEEYVSRLSVDPKAKSDETEKDKIAVIYAEGTVNYFEDSKKIGDIITPETIQKKLAIAEENPSIKGIVLRINSPGGSALASDIIYNSIKNTTKPVYISMGGVAASGGYYIAVAGDKIYADKQTLTGSIGVITMIPNASELMKKLDVNFSTIKKGDYADMESPTKEMTDDEKDKIRASSIKVYEEFVSKVAEGRKMSREDVLKVAGGRVWLGRKAKEIGLVDEIGGIEKAVDDLAKDLGLTDYETLESLKEEKIESVIKNYLPKYLMAKIIDKNLNKVIEENNNLSQELLYKPVLYAPNVDI